MKHDEDCERDQGYTNSCKCADRAYAKDPMPLDERPKLWWVGRR